MRARSIVLAAMLCMARAVSATMWRVGHIPVREGARIANPDALLSPDEVARLESKMSLFEDVHTVPIAGEAVPVQIAATIIDRMNMAAFEDYEEDMEDAAAEAFAMELHNKLGVGHTTEEGGTGVYIFLSTYDRVMFISRGGAVSSHLSNFRIDHIVHDLKPTLKGAKYGDALSDAIDRIGEYIDRGKPTWRETAYETFVSFFPIIAFLSVIGAAVFVKTRHERHQQRQYAQVESQLSELDRARAEALQGQYQATSCPICLDDFVSDTVGSDEQPIKLLRCGHAFDEGCWAEWVNSGRGNVRQCPICKADVGGASDASNATARSAVDTNTNNAAPNQPRDVGRNQDQAHDHAHDQNPNLANNLVAEDANRDREQDRAMRRYVRERNFRLARLATRFPQYVNQQQVQRWSNPNYNDSLARDNQFRQSNPREVRRMQQQSYNRGNGSSPFSSFGGGSSSGGRGGRW